MQAVTCRSDSLPMALYDWKALGLLAIFRGTEWAQKTTGKVKYATMQLVCFLSLEYQPFPLCGCSLLYVGGLEELDTLCMPCIQPLGSNYLTVSL